MVDVLDEQLNMHVPIPHLVMVCFELYSGFFHPDYQELWAEVTRNCYFFYPRNCFVIPGKHVPSFVLDCNCFPHVIFVFTSVWSLT